MYYRAGTRISGAQCFNTYTMYLQTYIRTYIHTYTRTVICIGATGRVLSIRALVTAPLALAYISLYIQIAAAALAS